MMNECPNCGMLPWACVCIPWCYRHDVAQPCRACETDPAPDSDAWKAWLILAFIAAAGWVGYLALRHT